MRVISYGGSGPFGNSSNVTGQQGERLRADYPVAALQHAGLWELVGGAGRAHSDAGCDWFDAHRPRGGLVPAVYELARDVGEARVAAVGTILDTFFADADYVELPPSVLLTEIRYLAFMITKVSFAVPGTSLLNSK